jgi:hypothetical protein
VAGDLITGDYQMQLGTLLLGAGTAYEIDADEGLTGWDDLPGLDLADVPRPAAPGAYPGSIYPQSRIITVKLSVHDDGPGHAANVAALRAAITASLAGEVPLAVQLGGLLTYCGVRCLQRSLPIGDNYAGRRTGKAMLQFEATDPRRYTATLSSARTTPPAALGGITWPVTWPLVWPAGLAGGTVYVANGGDYNTPPVITVRGPLTTPAVYRQDTGDVLELNTTLGAADVVVIDVLADTLTLNGTSARTLLSDRSKAVSSFLMPPGNTALALRAAITDPSASMTVTWRSAYL